MKHLYKFLVAVVVVLGFVGVCNVREAKGATSSDGVWFPTLKNVDFTGCQYDWNEIMNKYQHCVVGKHSVSGHYHFVFIDDRYWKADSGGSAFQPYVLYVRTNSFNSLEGSWSIVVNSDGKVVGEYKRGGIAINNSVVTNQCDIIGSTFNYIASSSSYESYVRSLPQNNIVHPKDYIEPSGPSTTVDISVSGVDYTVSEPLEYYLALKDIRGNVLLLFSDTPFIGKNYDLYTYQFSVSPVSNVVSYHYSASSNNDFLESRSVSLGYESFITTNKDYFCNYHIHHTDDLLNIFLPEKECFDTEVSQTLETLCFNLPEELRDSRNFIIFQQIAKTACDDRIIFYGWNDFYSELFINISNSQICAIGKKGVVSDYITAYYDESQAVWVVSDDVVLGATTDSSYNVPYIFYTTSTLFVAYSDWSSTGNIVQMGNFYPPPFPEGSEGSEDDSQESLYDRFLNGFISGNSNMLKYLFVPSEGYFTAQFAELQSYFGFWTSVRDTADVFMNFLKNTDFSQPPKIEIDLSLAQTSVNYGGKVYLIDLSWYEPYKESVDVILSSILWLVFIWNTYKNLPNIIAGIGGGVQASSSLLDDGKEE